MEKVTVYEDYRNSKHFKWIHMEEYKQLRKQADRFDQLKIERKIVDDWGEATKKIFWLVFLVTLVIWVMAYFYAWVFWPAIIAVLWMFLRMYLNGMYQKAWLYSDNLKEQIKNTRIEKESISLRLENQAMRKYMQEKVITP